MKEVWKIYVKNMYRPMIVIAILLLLIILDGIFSWNTDRTMAFVIIPVGTFLEIFVVCGLLSYWKFRKEEKNAK